MGPSPTLTPSTQLSGLSCWSVLLSMCATFKNGNNSNDTAANTQTHGIGGWVLSWNVADVCWLQNADAALVVFPLDSLPTDIFNFLLLMKRFQSLVSCMFISFIDRPHINSMTRFSHTSSVTVIWTDLTCYCKIIELFLLLHLFL